ncbi:phosphatidylinositol 4-phosphate 5-kinase 4-like [Rosa sericea]
MDGQKSQAKLTRTQSSLLRSSPTIRSSIHSLHSMSSVTEEDVITAQYDEEEQKPKNSATTKLLPLRSGSTPRAGSTRNSGQFLAVSSLILFSFFGFLFFFFFYLRRDEIATSESLLLALVFVAVTLFLANKNKSLIHHSVSVMKHSWDEKSKRFRICGKAHNAKPVQWFIGSDPNPSKTRKEHRIIREGVEFYSNGDFYEGEFHKGKGNGSGVYNYFVNGRYEGDWIDAKYDGYGIESWARGSRYKGQYRQGSRHGYGVYRFYTGDSYSGEWCNGQSHGVGVQTCSDGSCYAGEFKYGAKHGLGCYHFRNGDRYAGEYFGDKIHGFGIYHFANGHCYEGSWHEGRKQGYGVYTFRSGDTRCGVWDGGTLKHPLLPLNDAVVRAVQAARRAAQNAANLRRVDEQVNKAVMASNRAATAARVAAVKAVQNRMDGKFCDTNV